jgi:hypothetical protein
VLQKSRDSRDLQFWTTCSLEDEISASPSFPYQTSKMTKTDLQNALHSYRKAYILEPEGSHKESICYLYKTEIDYI